MKKKLTALFAAACSLVLCFALAGCGGGGGGGGKADYSKNFVGTWVLSGGEMDGDAIDSATLDLMNTYGMNVYITFDKDGTVLFVLFGEEMSGDWKAKDASTATLTFDGDSGDAKLADGKLSLEADGDKLVFEKGEAPAKSSSGSTDTDVETAVGQDLNVTIADDDVCTITVLSSGTDSTDDPGYNINVVNKTDRAIYAYAEYGSFSVNGKMMEPGSGATVQPGKNADFFMFFMDLDTVEDLVNVEGTLVVVDNDTWDELARYDFTM